MGVIMYYRQKQGLSEGVAQMLQQKNRKNRTQAYNEYWMQGVDPLFEDTGLVVEYLTSLSGYSRPHLNSIRSERGGLAKDVFVKEFFQSVKKVSRYNKIQIPYFLSVQKRKA